MDHDSIIDRAQFNSHTILLVEDNEDDVLIMRCAFRKAGVPNPLQVAGDGEQAIAYLQGQGAYHDRQRHPLPIVILLDLNMPRKNGLEVLEWIRRQPGCKRVTVHILTASSRRIDVDRAFELGANSYLIKPGKLETLVEMLKTWHGLTQFQAFAAVDECGEDHRAAMTTVTAGA